MNELLKAYLIYADHYLAGHDLELYRTTIDDDEQVYEMNVKNECSPSGYECVTVNASDLLVFLFERQGGVA